MSKTKKQLRAEAYDRIAEARLEAENAKLRDELSKALDHAHAIGKLGEL